MKQIISSDNPLIKKIVQLASTKGREQYKQFIAEGLRTCQTLMQSPLVLDTFFVVPDTLEQAKLFAPEQKIILVSDAVMKKIAPTKSPSGFLSVFNIPHYAMPDKLVSGLVLCEINDPGNFGTLIRSAVAFDRPQIIAVGGVDPWNPKVIQACAGSIGFARIISLDWNQLVQYPQRPKLCALVVHGGEPIGTAVRDSLLVVGSEAHGLPENWLSDCQQRVTLAMPGGTESLNAAVAGSIALYQVVSPKPFQESNK